MIREELLYEIALSQVGGVGSVTARQLIAYCGSARAVFETPAAKLLKIPQIGPHLAPKLKLTSEQLNKAENTKVQAQKNGAQIISVSSPDYPKRLKNLHDAPLILYYKGEAELNPPKSLAIVGTRDASDYGKQATQEVVQSLKTLGISIISGLAYGIDIAAHRACLQQKTPTIGVMASGIDIVYPATHANTAQQMISQGGGLLTENPFGTKPDASRFPARNRIIAGMSDAVLVMEAKETGGALITADMAKSYQKKVFAWPGPAYSPTSKGCHQLIYGGQAQLVSSADHIAEVMGWKSENDSQAKQGRLNFDKLELGGLDRQILDLLQKAPGREMMIDEIAWSLQKPSAQISACLLNLELMDLIIARPGKKFGLALT